MVLRPRGVSAGLGGFSGYSNALIWIRESIDLRCFCGLEASQFIWAGSLHAQLCSCNKKHRFIMVLRPRGVSAYLGGFLTCSNALIFMRKNIDLGWFCGLEASQPVWTGSWNALFLIRKSIDLKLLCNLEESQLVWEGSLSVQVHWFE